MGFKIASSGECEIRNFGAPATVVPVVVVIAIAESLVRVVAAIRITSVRWRSYLPLKPQSLVLVDLAFVALRFESCDWRSFV